MKKKNPCLVIFLIKFIFKESQTKNNFTYLKFAQLETKLISRVSIIYNNFSISKNDQKTMDTLLSEYFVRKQIKEQLKISNAKESLILLYKVYAERILSLENSLSNIFLIIGSFSPQDKQKCIRIWEMSKNLIYNYILPFVVYSVSLQALIRHSHLIYFFEGQKYIILYMLKSSEWIEIVCIFIQNFTKIQTTIEDIQSMIQRGKIIQNNMNYLSKYLVQLKYFPIIFFYNSNSKIQPNDYTFEKIDGIPFDKRAIDLCYYVQQFFEGWKQVEKDNLIYEKKGKLPYEQSKTETISIVDPDQEEKDQLKTQLKKELAIQEKIETFAIKKEEEKLKMINNFLRESPESQKKEDSQSPKIMEKKSIKDTQALEALREARQKPKVQYQKKEATRKSGNQILQESKKQIVHKQNENKQVEINNQLQEYQKRMNAIQKLKQQLSEENNINPDPEDKKNEGYVPFRRSFLIQKEKQRISQPENIINEDEEPLEQEQTQKNFISQNKKKAVQVQQKQKKKKRASSENHDHETDQINLDPKIEQQAKQIIQKQNETPKLIQQMKQSLESMPLQNEQQKQKGIQQLPEQNQSNSKVIQTIKQDIKNVREHIINDQKQKEVKQENEIKQSISQQTRQNSPNKKVQFGIVNNDVNKNESSPEIQQKDSKKKKPDQASLAEKSQIKSDQPKFKVDQTNNTTNLNKQQQKSDQMKNTAETIKNRNDKSKSESEKKTEIPQSIIKGSIEQTKNQVEKSNQKEAQKQTNDHNKKQNETFSTQHDLAKISFEKYQTPPKKDFHGDSSPKKMTELSPKSGQIEGAEGEVPKTKRRLSARPDLGLHSFGLAKKLESIQEQLKPIPQQIEKVEEVSEKKEKKGKKQKKKKSAKKKNLSASPQKEIENEKTATRIKN